MIAIEAPGRGRPLRFVAWVAVGWVAMRVVLLWPEGATLPQAIEAAMPLRPAQAAAPQRTAPVLSPEPVQVVGGASTRVATRSAAVPPPAAIAPHMTNLAMLNLVSFGSERVGDGPVQHLPRIPTPPAMLAPRAAPNRWQASAWFVTRRSAPAGGAMLGGDQAGLRVARTLDRRGRLALYARASAPLAGTGRELALGIEWRPWRAPMRFLAEQRIALDQGQSGPAVAVVAGVSGVDLPFAFELEAYGQAGAVKRSRIDPFADGALRVTREVAAAGEARLALGAGAWGCGTTGGGTDRYRAQRGRHPAAFRTDVAHRRRLARADRRRRPPRFGAGAHPGRGFLDCIDSRAFTPSLSGRKIECDLTVQPFRLNRVSRRLIPPSLPKLQMIPVSVKHNL